MVFTLVCLKTFSPFVVQVDNVSIEIPGTSLVVQG